MLHVHVDFNNNVVSLITTHTKHWLHVKISVQKVKGLAKRERIMLELSLRFQVAR